MSQISSDTNSGLTTNLLKTEKAYTGLIFGCSDWDFISACFYDISAPSRISP